MNFCPDCGSRLIEREDGGRSRPACPACPFIHFGRRLVAVGGVVIKGDSVLLARRLMPPAAGQWTIPGGYVETDETLSQAVVREVSEETGVVCEVESLLSVRSVAFGARHDTYVAFALRYLSGDPVADGIENDEAQFVHQAELAAFGGLTGFSRTLAFAALGGAGGLSRFPYERSEPADLFVATPIVP